MTDEPKTCRLGLSQTEVDQLKHIAMQSDVLLSVAKAHAALILISHVAKWLSAILGVGLLIKGVFQ